MSELRSCEMVNSMICSWILNVIEPKLCNSVAFVETAELMWSNLKKHYAVANAPKIHQLKTSLVECNQGDTDVVEYFLSPWYFGASWRMRYYSLDVLAESMSTGLVTN